jgi:hypothetical protein
VSSVLAAGEGADYTFNSTYKDTIFVSGRYVEAGVENAFACVLPVEVETATLGSGEIIVRNYNNSITIENV